MGLFAYSESDKRRLETKKGTSFIRLLSTFAVLLYLLSISTSQAKQTRPVIKHHLGCNTKDCFIRVDNKQCSNSNPKACIRYVIGKKDIKEPERIWLLKIPGCESGWTPSDPPNSSGSTGLYQFQFPTWEGVERDSGYGQHSIYSARWQAVFASWLYEHDGSGREWSCTSILGLT